MNTAFRIAFGCYELVLDRKSLTYSLTETETGTLWGEGLSVGWIELQERASEKMIRHEFGDCKLISLSEKMSGAGKKILLGLDTPEGVPIDVYFTCAEKEIQLTVEASRDTKEFTLHRIGLLPGLCAGVVHYVLPVCEGRLVSPETLLDSTQILPVWGNNGLSMPFFGGLKSASALILITDSAYAAAELSRTSCDWVYENDPERRRLEIRLALIPNGDHIAVARAYREKLISERRHITLRKKMRENPHIEKILQSDELDYYLNHIIDIQSHEKITWDKIEIITEKIKQEENIKTIRTYSDWALTYADVSVKPLLKFLRSTQIPLFSVIYRDTVIDTAPMIPSIISEPWPYSFLRCLLQINYPVYSLSATYTDSKTYPNISEAENFLRSLYRITFSSFLISHRFLTEDLSVEETIYTNKTKVIVNFSDSYNYSCDEFELPPLGFVVFHSQLTAHDALRVGEDVFTTRKFRIVYKEVK